MTRPRGSTNWMRSSATKRDALHVERISMRRIDPKGERSARKLLSEVNVPVAFIMGGAGCCPGNWKRRYGQEKGGSGW